MTTTAEVTDMIERLSGMLQHVKDAFIRGSELEQKVTEMEARMSALTQSIEHYTGQLSVLNETVQRLSQERDEAQARARDWEAQHNAAVAEWSHRYTTMEHEFHETQGNLEQEKCNYVNLHNVFTAKEQALAEAAGEVQRLTEELAKINAKHEALRSHVEGLYKTIMPQPRDESSGQFAEYPKVQGW